MADEADLASEQSELFLRQSLANQAATQARPKGMAPKGSCWYCETVFTQAQTEKGPAVDSEGHPVDELGSRIDKKLFCDKDCSADYEEEKRLRNR